MMKIKYGGKTSDTFKPSKPTKLLPGPISPDGKKQMHFDVEACKTVIKPVKQIRPKVFRFKSRNCEIIVKPRKFKGKYGHYSVAMDRDFHKIVSTFHGEVALQAGAVKIVITP